MSSPSLFSRLRPDNYTLALVATVIVASLLPCRGQVADAFGVVTDLAIALLFFLHGAQAVARGDPVGAGHWRLHLMVLGATFVMFPLLGLLVTAFRRAWSIRRWPRACCSSACCRPRCSRRSRSPPWRGAMCRPPSARPRRRTCWASSSTPALAAHLPGPARRRRRPAGRRARHRHPAAGAVHRRPPGAAVDWRLRGPPQEGAELWSTAARSCWWSTPPSAPR